MANKPGDFSIFSSIDKNTINQMVVKFQKYLGNISSVLSVNTSEIFISEDVMIEIIERVEKRRVYFYIFYDGCEMEN
jgi:hypothetical protein